MELVLNLELYMDCNIFVQTVAQLNAHLNVTSVGIGGEVIRQGRSVEKAYGSERSRRAEVCSVLH